MPFRWQKHKNRLRRKVVLPTIAKRYLERQQHYHVEIVPSTHDALINISYSFCREATMQDEKGERRYTNWEEKKKSLWSQSCQYNNAQPSSWIQEDFGRMHSCGTAFGKMNFYLDENNIDGLYIEWPRYLHIPQQHLKALKMNWAFISQQAAQLISAMGWLRARPHSLWGLTKGKVAAMANACAAFES